MTIHTYIAFLQCAESLLGQRREERMQLGYLEKRKKGEGEEEGGEIDGKINPG